MKRISFALLFLLGCFGGLAGAAESDARVVALKARGVLKQYCHRCHNGKGSEGGDFDVLSVSTLTPARGPDKRYVDPGKPDASYLFERVIKGSMPPKEVRERPSDADKETLRRWIEAGAPSFPTTTTRAFRSQQDVLSTIYNHLRAADRADVPHLRFFTLTHLHNNPTIPDGDLSIYRAALSKVVNSLSLTQRIIAPQAVDKEETVFVIDDRHLDWVRGRLWREILKAYPYGLRYDLHPDAGLRNLDKDIEQLTQCELVYVRADWFVAMATRPPLYHRLLFSTLLDLPGDSLQPGAKEPRRRIMTVGQLEDKLRVQVVNNFRNDQLARAGFAKSGVSGQNRLLERHDSFSEFGRAYWKSYDFKADNPRGNLTRFPLGPEFPGHPHADQAFVHDGGEIIFQLPNGLQGYLLVDEQGRRIDEGPVAVVSDALRTSGTPAIVNGLSCMACHKHGMVPFQDNIRLGAAVGGGARQKVERLYPTAPDMGKLFQKDQDRFVRALEEAIGPFLQVGDTEKKPVREFDEPVGEVARLYRLRDLDLTTVACELGFARPADLQALITSNKKLREMGLAPLLQAGVGIKRHDWVETGDTPLFQRVAEELERGTPLSVTK